MGARRTGTLCVSAISHKSFQALNMADCLVSTGVYRKSFIVSEVVVGVRAASCDRRRLIIFNFNFKDSGRIVQHW